MSVGYLARVLEALAVVAPWCVAARYKDLSHCVEASVCGAAALRRRKIKARPAPCAVYARYDETLIGLGCSAKHIYSLTGSMPASLDSHIERDPDRQWVPCHEVIEVKAHGIKAIVDMTIGQLKQCARSFPTYAISAVSSDKTDGWPTLYKNGWTIRYEAPQHSLQEIEDHNRQVNKYSNHAFVDDIHDMIELALQLNLDRYRIYEELSRQCPEAVADSLSVLGLVSPPLAGCSP